MLAQYLWSDSLIFTFACPHINTCKFQYVAVKHKFKVIELPYELPSLKKHHFPRLSTVWAGSMQCIKWFISKPMVCKLRFILPCKTHYRPENKKHGNVVVNEMNLARNRNPSQGTRMACKLCSKDGAMSRNNPYILTEILVPWKFKNHIVGLSTW